MPIQPRPPPPGPPSPPAGMNGPGANKEQNIEPVVVRRARSRSEKLKPTAVKMEPPTEPTKLAPKRPPYTQAVGAKRQTVPTPPPPPKRAEASIGRPSKKPQPHNQ